MPGAWIKEKECRASVCSCCCDEYYCCDCDYFFQCGDDIEFKTNGWVEDCISKLQENNNIGLVGPVNNNPRIHRHYGSYCPVQHTISWSANKLSTEIITINNEPS